MTTDPVDMGETIEEPPPSLGMSMEPGTHPPRFALPTEGSEEQWCHVMKNNGVKVMSAEQWARTGTCPWRQFFGMQGPHEFALTCMRKRQQLIFDGK